MQRREFIGLTGAAAITWPLAARARQGVKRIGVLSGQAESDPEGRERFGAFRQSLEKLGWSDGRNLRIAYRWLGGADPSRASAYASEVVETAPDLILVNGTAALAAMQRATKTIPVVFAQVSDPVGGGFVASVSRPGGNITGFTDYEYAFAVKWLELLKEIAPNVVKVAVLHEAGTALSANFLPYIEAAGPSLGMQVLRAAINNPDDIVPVIDTFAAGGPNGASPRTRYGIDCPPFIHIACSPSAAA